MTWPMEDYAAPAGNGQLRAADPDALVLSCLWPGQEPDADWQEFADCIERGPLSAAEVEERAEYLWQEMLSDADDDAGRDLREQMAQAAGVPIDQPRPDSTVTWLFVRVMRQAQALGTAMRQAWALFWGLWCIRALVYPDPALLNPVFTPAGWQRSTGPPGGALNTRAHPSTGPPAWRAARGKARMSP